MTEPFLLPSPHSGPRHAAPRDPSRPRAVLLPGVLLAAAGTAFAGLAIMPAATADVVPRVSATLALAPVELSATTLAAPANQELMIALQRGAAVANTPPPPAAPPPPVTAPAALTAPAAVAAVAAPRTPVRATRDRTPVVPEVLEAVGEFVRPGAGRLTSPFGRRWGRLHAGIDLAAGIGSPIRAVAKGTVIDAGTESGYGKTIRIVHPDGVVSVYGHMSALLVKTGDKVGAGEQIGREGNTGRSTGPHLHFEIRINGTPVNPAPWLAKRGIRV